MPPPGDGNRFVSYVTAFETGAEGSSRQRVEALRVGRVRQVLLVLVPGAGLPEGVKITMRVDSDGIPDPRFYEPIGQ
jgi:hypothetical protein